MSEYRLYLADLSCGCQHAFFYSANGNAHALFTCLCIKLATFTGLSSRQGLFYALRFFFNFPFFIQYRIVLSLTPSFFAIELMLLPSFNCTCTRSITCGNIL